MILKQRPGMVHVYTGDGKGKTTSSLGLALRSVGHGNKVLIVQFMKGGRYYGEIEAIENILPNIEIAQFGQGCVNAEEIKTGEKECNFCRKCFIPYEEEKQQARKAFKFAKNKIETGGYDLLILDEINVALAGKQLPIRWVLELIVSKPEKLEIVLTGRDAPGEIIAAADYVSEIKMIKHPFNKGTKAKRGIEY